MTRKVKWFKPRSKQTGWKKTLSARARRRKAIKTHKSFLSAGRSLQALANVTKDKETRKKAKADAEFFFEQHRRM